MCCCDNSYDCGLDTEHPCDIVRPLCRPYCNVKFLVYRLLLACYFIVYLVIHMCASIITSNGIKILIYFSDWTLILTTVYVVIALLNGLADYAWYHQRGGHDINSLRELPIMYRLQWFLFNTCISTSIAITLTYWPTAGLHLTPYDIAIELNIHALPAIILLLDLLVTAVPIRFTHVIFPLVYGLLYVIFSLIYWVAGGTNVHGYHNIYSILNYNHPKVAGVVILVEAIGIIVIHCILKGLYVVRNKLSRRCNCFGRNTGSEELPLSDSRAVLYYHSSP